MDGRRPSLVLIDAHRLHLEALRRKVAASEYHPDPRAIAEALMTHPESRDFFHADTRHDVPLELLLQSNDA